MQQLRLFRGCLFVKDCENLHTPSPCCTLFDFVCALFPYHSVYSYKEIQGFLQQFTTSPPQQSPANTSIYKLFLGSIILYADICQHSISLKCQVLSSFYTCTVMYALFFFPNSPGSSLWLTSIGSRNESTVLSCSVVLQGIIRVTVLSFILFLLNLHFLAVRSWFN